MPLGMKVWAGNPWPWKICAMNASRSIAAAIPWRTFRLFKGAWARRNPIQKTDRAGAFTRSTLRCASPATAAAWAGCTSISSSSPFLYLAVALAKYKNGELDEIDVQPAQAAAVAGDAHLNVDLVKAPALSVFWIGFRLAQAPLNNLKVRQGMAAAIDRDAFIAQIFQGQGLPAQTFIPKGMRGYAPDLGSTQTFDVARARATFAASGATAKDFAAVKFSYDQSSDFSKATAKFIHDQLKTNLGVDITLEALDSTTLGSHLDTGDFQIAVPLGWMADYPDPADQ